MARRVARQFARPPKKTTVWFSAGVTLVSTAGSAASLVSSWNAAALALRPFMILRTRLVVWASSDQTAAAEFSQSVYSMQIVQESAITAGIAAVPTPITETNSDFFVYQPLFQALRFTTDVGKAQIQGEQSCWVVDSKAMRKVNETDDMAVVVENRSAFGLEVAVEGRMLIQLP